MTVCLSQVLRPLSILSGELQDSEIVAHFASEAGRVRKEAEARKGSRFASGLLSTLIVGPLLYVGLILLARNVERSDVMQILMAAFVSKHPVWTGLIVGVFAYVLGHSFANELNRSIAEKAKRRAFELEWKAAIIRNLSTLSTEQKARDKERGLFP